MYWYKQEFRCLSRALIFNNSAQTKVWHKFYDYQQNAKHYLKYVIHVLIQWNPCLTICQGSIKIISLNRKYRYTGVLPHRFYYNFNCWVGKRLLIVIRNIIIPKIVKPGFHFNLKIDANKIACTLEMSVFIISNVNSHLTRLLGLSASL